ncbi:MAG: lactonase family protein [Chloroflexales bacterium]|nr:lactonase family protein [Chloroflexales bacterium]
MSVPQPHLLLVGSYAAAEQPGIHAFWLDPASGALAHADAFAGVASPSFLAISPAGTTVLAASETSAGDGSPGGVAALRLRREPLALTPLGQQRSGGDWPCHICISADGCWALVSNYGSGTVGVLPILSDGSLGPLRDLAHHEGRSVNDERQAGPHTHAAIFDQSGRFVIVADLGLDQLVIYRFEHGAGQLTSHGLALARRGAGPRHMAFHPGGRLLYVANELDSTVSVYDYDPAEGRLDERQAVTTLPKGAPDNQVADIHLDAAGRRLYVSNRGHNSLAVFSIDAYGQLTLSTIAPSGGGWPRSFALTPDGRFALVANQLSGDLVVLPLGAGAEAVGAPVARASVPSAACVIIAG